MGTPDQRHAADDAMFSAVTRDIEVTVLPEFLPERSDEARGQFFWAYTIEIANNGANVVQLTHRHWIITDADGRREEIRGPGVVGEQPVLKPGEIFRYTSGCPLATRSGFMKGSYRMVEKDGAVFEAQIPLFALDVPHGARVLH